MIHPQRDTRHETRDTSEESLLVSRVSCLVSLLKLAKVIRVLESLMLPPRFTLRELPFSARLTLALFLVSVGLGYGAALVQIHFQHASPGEFMPSAQDVVVKFHGDPDPT